MRRAAASIATTVLALAAANAGAAMNKCTDRNGKVSYQEGLCPPDSRQERVIVMPGPAAGPAPAGQAEAPNATAGVSPGLLPPRQDRPDPRMDALVSALATYEGCEAAAPEFARKNAPRYQAWRASNAELIDLLPRSQRYMKVLAVERQRVQFQLAQQSTRKAFADSCPAKLAPILGSAKNP